LAVPAFLPGLSGLRPPRAGIGLGSHLRLWASDLRMAALQTAWALALLPDQAWRTTDAIARTLTRLYLTHRHLLEWTTAAQTAARPPPGMPGSCAQMAGGLLLAVALAVLVGLFSPAAWPLGLPLLALWLAAPALAWRASRRPPLAQSGAPGAA